MRELSPVLGVRSFTPPPQRTPHKTATARVQPENTPASEYEQLAYKFSVKTLKQLSEITGNVSVHNLGRALLWLLRAVDSQTFPQPKKTGAYLELLDNPGSAIRTLRGLPNLLESPQTSRRSIVQFRKIFTRCNFKEFRLIDAAAELHRLLELLFRQTSLPVVPKEVPVSHSNTELLENFSRSVTQPTLKSQIIQRFCERTLRLADRNQPRKARTPTPNR